MINEFLALPRSCVFSIEDVAGKRIYINYSEGIASSLARLWEELQKEVRAGTTLKLSVLEVSNDLEHLRLFTEYWRAHYYRNIGYDMLFVAARAAIKYDVVKMVASDFKTIQVCLKSARGARKVVGLFKTHKDADQFIEEYYGAPNPFHFPIYALNDLTKSHIMQIEMKGRGIRI